MNFLNGNPNLYYLAEDFNEDTITIQLYPIISFSLDHQGNQHPIALKLGKVEGTLYDSNLKTLICGDNTRKSPDEYMDGYINSGIEVYMSEEEYIFLGLIDKESEPSEVYIANELPLAVSIHSSVEIPVSVENAPSVDAHVTNFPQT